MPGPAQTKPLDFAESVLHWFQAHAAELRTKGLDVDAMIATLATKIEWSKTASQRQERMREDLRAQSFLAGETMRDAFVAAASLLEKASGAFQADAPEAEQIRRLRSEIAALAEGEGRSAA